jgi:ABC-type Fe3+ transport system substrate-binding protein
VEKQQMNKRVRMAACASTAGLLLLAGCGSGGSASNSDARSTSSAGEDWLSAFSEDYEAAKDEGGSFSVFSLQQPVTNEDLQNEFNRLFPDAPDVTVATFAGSEVDTRYAAERQSGQCEAAAIIAESASVLKFADKGWIADQSNDAIPERNDYADRFLGDTYTVFGLTPQGIAFNTDEVTKIDSIDDMLNPDLKGRIGLGDPRAQLASLTALWALYKKGGEEALEGLAALNPTYHSSAVTGIAAVASGESAVFYPGYEVVTAPLVKKGAPLGFERVDGLTASTGVVAISDGDSCDHQASARLFTRFVLSPKGQSISNGIAKKASGNATTIAYSGLKEYPEPISAESIALPTPDELEVARPEILAALGLTG